MKSQLLTPDFVRKALRRSSSGKSNEPFTSITTDSRKITPGCLFVALKGDQFDGHDFIDAAISKGAQGVLCKKDTSIKTTSSAVEIFDVQDPLDAYRVLAAAWRQLFSIPVIAVAGSAGKTTTKELLAAILSGKWANVLKTQKSQNGFIGIPMTLLELNSSHQIAVIEVGIDEIGAMQQHIPLVSPTVSLLTSIGPEHLEKLRDIPTVAHEEGIALTSVSRLGGTYVVNLDDPWIQPHATQLKKGKKVTFSLQAREFPSSALHLYGELHADGKRIQIYGTSSKPLSITLPLPGKHNASNLLAALAVAKALGMTSDEMLRGLENFKGAEGRSELRELPGSTHVLCDYYNAQPLSMVAGLELLAQVAAQGNSSQSTWACLADMLELGPLEAQFHRELSQKLIELKIQNILLFGPRMTELDDELRKKGFKGYHAHFKSQAELGKVLTDKVKKGDSILIKGSRGMKMEEVWKILESYAKSQWSSQIESKNPTSHP